MQRPCVIALDDHPATPASLKPDPDPFVFNRLRKEDGGRGPSAAIPDDCRPEPALQESLFKGDQAVLSNQDIDRILSAHVDLSDRRRLVALGLSPRSIWAPEFAVIDEQNSAQFLKALAAAPNLAQVRMMPQLLVPEKRTIPYLREAAARFQADLLLVYAARIRTFQRDRILSANEVNAEASAEAVLLDVRTGIVVQSARASEAIAAKKAPGDLNFAQTVAKAEEEASGRALLKLADSVTAFLRETK